MIEFNYRQFYDKVGSSNGWDFSTLNITTEGNMKELYEHVDIVLFNKELLLDIGTGGGERVLAIAEQTLLTIGIDNSSTMIKKANENAYKQQRANTRFIEMDASAIQFPTEFFDIVTCRQAPFEIEEVKRVLKHDGIFMTQQIGRNDKLNIIQAFGREQNTGSHKPDLKQIYYDQLREAGFSNIEVTEYDVVEYYHTPEDLIFLLKHTPIVPNFGQHEEDFTILEQFIKENQTDKGIKTNSARFIIRAIKSS